MILSSSLSRFYKNSILFKQEFIKLAKPTLESERQMGAKEFEAQKIRHPVKKYEALLKIRRRKLENPLNKIESLENTAKGAHMSQ